MQQKSSIKVRGDIHVRVVGPDGTLKHEVKKKNMVVDAGLALIVDRLMSAVPLSQLLVKYIAVGTGVTGPDNANTQLQTENARKAVASRASDGVIGSTSTVFNAGDVPTSTLKEVGLFIDGSATANTGTLLARQSINVPVTALDSVFIDWRLTLASA